MKPVVALRTGMLVAGLAAAWLGSTRADVITFDVPATMLPQTGGGARPGRAGSAFHSDGLALCVPFRNGQAVCGHVD
jgi:hypothetical protein